MKRKFFKFTAAILSVLIMVGGTVGCGNKGGGDITFDDSGNIIPSDETIYVNYWGVADEYEQKAMNAVVDAFNAKYKGVIQVEYTPKPANGYSENFVLNMLGGPDVAQVDESYFKGYVEQGVLADITSLYNDALNKYVSTNGAEGLDGSDMMEGIMDRYRYNVTTTTSNPSDPLFAVMKDLTPTATYFNTEIFAKAGITVISESEESIAAWNKANPSNKKIIKAYYVQDGKHYFNKSIAMSWQECIDLSKKLMADGDVDYGFFTEWWFNHGFSVGGDCIEYVETSDSQYNGGYWEFTLNDSSKNYIVKDDVASLTVNGNTYKAGEIISWTDKKSLTDSQKASCNQLPSQREAFTEFVRLSQPASQVVDNVNGVYSSVSDFYGADANGNLYGYGITPAPKDATEGKANYFSNGKVAMLATTTLSQRQFAELMGEGAFDVAPMLQYKEYSEDGTEVLVHGIQAGHSQSEGIAINANSENKNAAWVFVQYVASKEGQEVFASTGQGVPYYKSLAFDPNGAFLTNPYGADNAIVFANATENQTPGDWWYLKDNKWITAWSTRLNTEVRNGDWSLSEFYNSTEYLNTQALLNAYTKKK